MTLRYNRQELHPLVGTEGQKKIRKATIAVVGVGALGSTAAELLCRAGIGGLLLIDRDFVDEANLQRQMLYGERDVGTAKAMAAKEQLELLNKDVKIEAFVEDLHAETAERLLEKADVIVDGTDNLETRFLLNEYSLKTKKPWVYGGAIQDRGFVMAFLGRKPCFRCVVKEQEGLETCDTSGVLNTITTLIASVQVNEVLKILLGRPAGQMIHVRLMDNRFDVLNVAGNPSCDACKGHYDYLDGRKERTIVRFCRTGQFQIFSRTPLDLAAMKKRLERVGRVEDLGFCLAYNGMKIFRDRVMIPANNEREAKSLYAKAIGS